MQILTRGEWTERASAHAARVHAWTGPHLERRRRGERHPVHDFLFDYYNYSPAALARWHPGFGVGVADAPEYGVLTGYQQVEGVHTAVIRDKQRPVIEAIARLLRATAGRAPSYGCFGLHEWAMVYLEPDTRHPDPLRLGAAGTDRVVESHRIACSHFDAFRFFTPSARRLNTLNPGSADRPAFEQPGCLHAGMDLYKHAYRLSPLVPAELIADAFELAWDIREWDMRASPYDLSAWGYQPVPIETAGGKAEYAAAQRGFSERGAPIRQQLIHECERLPACESGLHGQATD